jgi:hypothetical protein
LGSVVLVEGTFKLLKNNTITQESCIFVTKMRILDSEDPAAKKFLNRVIAGPRRIQSAKQ